MGCGRSKSAVPATPKLGSGYGVAAKWCSWEEVQAERRSPPHYVSIRPIHSDPPLRTRRIKVRTGEPTLRIRAKLFDCPPHGWPEVPPPCATQLLLDGRALNEDQTYLQQNVPQDALLLLSFDPGVKLVIRVSPQAGCELTVWPQESLLNVLTRALKRVVTLDTEAAVAALSSTWYLSRTGGSLEMQHLISELELVDGDLLTNDARLVGTTIALAQEEAQEATDQSQDLSEGHASYSLDGDRVDSPSVYEEPARSISPLEQL